MSGDCIYFLRAVICGISYIYNSSSSIIFEKTKVSANNGYNFTAVLVIAIYKHNTKNRSSLGKTILAQKEQIHLRRVFST